MISPLQVLDLACLSILFGAWLRLAMQEAMTGTFSRGHLAAVAALILMCASAGMLMIDIFIRGYAASGGDLAMHSSLALWNGLTLVGVIKFKNGGARPHRNQQ